MRGADLSGAFGKDFAKPSPLNGGRAAGNRRGAGRRVKGATRLGRRVPPTAAQIAFAARVRDKEAVLHSSRASVKFHCGRCGKETNSALAKGTLCHVCAAQDAVLPDRAEYLAVTRKMARYAAQGRPTGRQFAQAARVHDRVVRTLMAHGVDEAQARDYVEKMLEESQKLGGRIAVPRLGDLLRKMGVKVES